MIDDYQVSGWINRWNIIDGEARCADDAIPPTDADAAKALGRNAVVRSLLAAGNLPGEDGIEAALAAAEPVAPIIPVPESVPRQNFFHAAVEMGLITPPEGLAAARTGELPSLLEQVVSSIPPPYDFEARMALQASGAFRRKHPFVEMFARMLGWTDAQVDEIFRIAGKP